MILCPTLDLHISVFMLFCCLLLPRSAARVSAGGGAGTEVVYSTLYCVQGGQLERLRGLLQQSPWSVDARCRHTGDTALIKASRQSHDKVRAAPSPLTPHPLTGVMLPGLRLLLCWCRAVPLTSHCRMTSERVHWTWPHLSCATTYSVSSLPTRLSAPSPHNPPPPPPPSTARE